MRTRETLRRNHLNSDAAKVFLTAEWKHLAILHHEIAPAVLKPYAPAATELDSWQGRHLVSVVGFRFLGTRVLETPIPFHCNFEGDQFEEALRRPLACAFLAEGSAVTVHRGVRLPD